MLLKYIDVKSKIFYYLQVHSINLKYKKKPILRSFKRTFRQVGPSYSAVEPCLAFTKLQALTSHLAGASAENVSNFTHGIKTFHQKVPVLFPLDFTLLSPTPSSSGHSTSSRAIWLHFHSRL